MTRARDIASGINTRDDSGEAVPHIIPGVLYPAVGGNDINGTDIDTSHGSTYTYGTAHADGRKYYYTDIKGSKPIRDPRIGAHFGSQRHKFKSLQLLSRKLLRTARISILLMEENGYVLVMAIMFGR